jgi:uncharacterized protein YceH (UPF0502 family)
MAMGSVTARRTHDQYRGFTGKGSAALSSDHCRRRYTSAMLTVTPHEARVLGVLVEKAQTTPAQYPMTLNAMVAGANQKNNRDPVTNLSEEQVLEALEGLRAKRLANEVMLSGSRVQKYRHIAREALEIGTSELVILAELLLRGPQTLGELRGRASRMHPLESTDIVKNIIESLMNREAGALVKELPPAPGDRSPRYMQLLCPNLHPENAPVQAFAGEPTGRIPVSSPAQSADILNRIAELESEVAHLRRAVQAMAESLGEPDLMRAAD